MLKDLEFAMHTAEPQKQAGKLGIFMADRIVSEYIYTFGAGKRFLVMCEGETHEV